VPASQLPPPLAEHERAPLVTFGAGSIVRDAHAPAARLCKLPLLGVYDCNPEAARAAVSELGYTVAASSAEDAVARGAAAGAVFDLALPPDAIPGALEALPDGAAVLIQKPLGKSLSDAEEIYRICERKKLTVGVNLQLPFSPQIVAATGALALGAIGPLRSARVELDLRTEWSLWEFLLHEPRIEILLHSIHYLSLFAHYLGPPRSLSSRQSGDPSHPVFRDRDICSETDLDYEFRDGSEFTASIRCNHLSRKPKSEWRSELVLTGERGEIVAGIHDNLDYPNGVDDTLVVRHGEFGEARVELVGNRFPMAFVATLTHLERAHASRTSPPNDLALGLLTMRLAECCYVSNARGGGVVALGESLSRT
jgi:predicted dehydrogenase